MEADPSLVIFPVPEWAAKLPLPPGWEERVHKGKKYYADNNTKTTTYEDPRLRPLPVGWEMKWDAEQKKVYFCDHTNKTTTYNHPRTGAPVSTRTTPQNLNTPRPNDPLSNLGYGTGVVAGEIAAGAQIFAKSFASAFQPRVVATKPAPSTTSQ